MGDSKDEEFLSFLAGKLKEKDPVSARLMFSIFQERIQGFKLMDSQKVQTVRKVKEKKNPSELAKYLLDNYEFA